MSMPPCSKPGSVTRSFPGVQAIALALVAALSVGALQAAPDDGNADIVLDTDGNLIGVDELPDGVVGGIDEINHDPATDQSQALAVDFGTPVTDLRFRVTAFQQSEGGSGNSCTEVGRYTAFNASGQFVASETFQAANGSGTQTVDVSVDGVRYLALSAEPYAPSDGCGVTNDSSDFSVRWFRFCFEGAESCDDDEGFEEVDAVRVDAGEAPGPLYAYDTDEDFEDEAGFLLPPGEEAPEEDITVGGGGDAGIICEGGELDEDTGACEVRVGNDLSTLIEEPGDAVGSFSIRETLAINDPRTACQDPPSGDPSPLQLTDSITGIGDLLADVNMPVTIPAALCGIPDVDTGQPVIKVVVIDSSLEVSSSVITHIVDDPANPDFECRAPAAIGGSVSPSPTTLRGRQPVFGWLPRYSETLPEVPVIDATGNIVTTLQDVTAGCGTYRGRTKRLSYLVYNLRYLEGTDFTPIIAQDIAALRATLAQADTGACAPGPATAALRGSYAFLLQFAELYYNLGFAPFAKQNLLAFRAGLLQGGGDGPFSQSLDGCFYNYSSGTLQADDFSNSPGVVPRNFRGDLLIRVEHVLYMLETMQGVLNPPS